jgi:hypothetical protein
LTEDLPEVNLAVSLHAPNQTMRTAIVPSAKRYPIEELIDALDNHMMTFASKHQRRSISSDENPQNGECIEPTTIKDDYTIDERIKESTRRRAMIEYVMLEGETSTIEAAHELGKLCEGRQLVVNLIPYNQTDVKDVLRCPSEDHMQLFRNIVASYGSFCTIRRTMGADIDSACGQLVTLENKRKKKHEHQNIDIEDVVSTSKIVVLNENPKQSSISLTSIGDNATTTCDTNSFDDGIYLQSWINTLTVATIVSATCFIATTCLFLHQQHRRRQ